MPPRLRQHAVARVDQDDRQVGGGGARRHVARVLLVPRRIGDDELAPRGGEITVSDIDGDSLLALGAQAVRKQRKIDGTSRPVYRSLGHRLQLIFIHVPRVVKKPADERGLTVVHAPGGGESQEILGLFLRQERFNVESRDGIQGRNHQKYPSRFFSSMEPS